MKKLLILVLLALGLLHANECENKRFTLNASQNRGSALTLMDLVRDVAQTCHVSVVFDDRRAKERLTQPLDMVNIRDYTLPELFTFLFDEHNLFYTYDPERSVLRVAYTKTVNYNIDYINMTTLMTESSKSITVGAGNSSNNGIGNSGYGSNNSYNSSAYSNTSGTSTGSGTQGMRMGGAGANTDYTNVRAVSKFTFWDQLHDHIQQILQVDDEYNEALNKTLVNRDAAVVTVSGTKRQLDSVKRYLDKLEARMHSQVMIEANLIELTYDDYNTSGVNWSDFSLGLSGSYSNSYNNLGVAHPVYSFGIDFNPAGLIDFLNRYGDVEVLSNPKVLTLSNQPAVINVGKQLSYLYSSGSITTTTTGAPSAATTSTLESIFVGLTLNIIPEVTEDGYIVMRINPVSSEVVGEDTNSSLLQQSASASTTRTMPPDTRIKQMSSIVKVKDHQHVIIGGLIEKKVVNYDNKVPLLGDIPLLGALFHGSKASTRKSELIILITPSLIKNDIFPSIGESFPSIDDTKMRRLN